MPFVFDPSPPSGALRQGEILSDVYEYQALHPPIENTSNDPLLFQPLQHPLLIVMTADCDLLQDYVARRNAGNQGEHPNLLPHILFSELHEESEIRGRVSGSDVWRRIRQNQDERYHKLPAAPIGNLQVDQLPDLYLDFKKTLTLPAQHLHEALEQLQLRRLAVVPPIYVHDLMHRFYSFLGRVGVPE